MCNIKTQVCRTNFDVECSKFKKIKCDVEDKVDSAFDFFGSVQCEITKTCGNLCNIDHINLSYCPVCEKIEDREGYCVIDNTWYCDCGASALNIPSNRSYLQGLNDEDFAKFIQDSQNKISTNWLKSYISGDVLKKWIDNIRNDYLEEYNRYKKVSFMELVGKGKLIFTEYFNETLNKDFVASFEIKWENKDVFGSNKRICYVILDGIHKFELEDFSYDAKFELIKE